MLSMAIKNRVLCLIELLHVQVASVTSDIQQQLGSTVDAALSAALPRELAGPEMKAALEASLGSQLQQSLAQPLQHSFSAAFQHQLMPAFEGACRDMFAQVSAAGLHAAGHTCSTGVWQLGSVTQPVLPVYRCVKLAAV